MSDHRPPLSKEKIVGTLDTVRAILTGAKKRPTPSVMDEIIRNIDAITVKVLREMK